MLERFQLARREYPAQYWLLFWGMLISTSGASMIWPFLLIYVTKRLGLPLGQVTILTAINSTAGVIFGLLAGGLVDRLGRKWVMVVSLALNGLMYIFLSRADTLLEFAIVMACTGAVNPIYRVGADAMLADLIAPAKRADAYALLRLINNVGVAIGPTVGGFIASRSYTLAFMLALAGMVTYSLLMAFFAHETLPERPPEARGLGEVLRGYMQALTDPRLVLVAGNFAFTQVCAVLMWVLMPVYANQNFGVPENQYGWIPGTNALTVVIFQLLITNFTKHQAPLPMMALGSLFYALGVGSVALGGGYWGFWASMVIMTVGEMILMPTSSTYVAGLAPAEKRGRYMSVYGLTWGVAAAVAPLFGGYLNDHYGPTTIWYGGLAVGLVSVLAFLLQARFLRPEEPAMVEAIIDAERAVEEVQKVD